VLDLVRPWLDGALRVTQARGRLVRVLADDPRSGGGDAARPRGRDRALQPRGPGVGWPSTSATPTFAEWLVLPPRPPLVSERDGRRLTVWRSARTAARGARGGRPPDALDRLVLTARTAGDALARALRESLLVPIEGVRSSSHPSTPKKRAPCPNSRTPPKRRPSPGLRPRSPRRSRTAHWKAGASRLRWSRAARRRQSTCLPTTGARAVTVSPAGSRAVTPRRTRSCTASSCAARRGRVCPPLRRTHPMAILVARSCEGVPQYPPRSSGSAHFQALPLVA